MDLPPERVERCKRVAGEALDRHGLLQAPPPVAIDRLAELCGFQVVRLYSVDNDFSGIVSPSHKLIGINGNHHRHRQRFTIAHELAHILLNHPPESACTSREVAMCNREADLCASELLIPPSVLEAYRTRIRSNSVVLLARLFDVSEEAMVTRLKSFNDNEPVT